MVRNPGLKMTTEIKKFVREHCQPTEQDTAVRRLQRKWKDSREARLTDAREPHREKRQARREAAAEPIATFSSIDPYLLLRLESKRARQALEPPAAQTAMKMIEDGSAAHMLERFQSPALRIMRERMVWMRDQFNPLHRLRGFS